VPEGPQATAGATGRRPRLSSLAGPGSGDRQSGRTLPAVIGRAHLLLLKIFRRLPRRGRIFVVHALAPSYTVGAICVIERDDGAILLIRHSYRGKWGLPGGLLRRGETAQAAAVREAMEEVGAAIELVGEPAVVVDPRPRRVDVVFPCRLADAAAAGDVTPESVEVVETGWFSLSALPELQTEAAGSLVALARARWPGRSTFPHEATS
jgi:8-oxo-dGTP diphosphatase